MSRADFTSLLNTKTSEASRSIPFGSDYAILNKYKFLLSTGTDPERCERLKKDLMDIYLVHVARKCGQLSAHLDMLRDLIAASDTTDEEFAQFGSEFISAETSISEFKESISEFQGSISSATFTLASTSPWQTALFEAYQNKYPIISTQSPDHFVAFLLETSAHYLPDTYATHQNSAAEIKFPSSTEKRDPKEFAHFQACFVRQKQFPGGRWASHVPQKNISSALDQRALDSFQDMLERRNIKHVISLGINKNRLDYKNFCQRQSIGITNFSVEDNASLNLSDDNLKKLLHLYYFFKSDNILVHCDSGVGRTGQLLLILALRDKFVIDKKFHDACNQLISHLLDGKMDHDAMGNPLDTIFNVMVETLNQLRKVRYSVQTEVQFAGTLPQLLLLMAVERGCQPAALNTLRALMGVSVRSTLDSMVDHFVQVEETTVALTATEESSSSDDDDTVVCKQQKATLLAKPSDSDEEEEEEQALCTMEKQRFFPRPPMTRQMTFSSTNACHSPISPTIAPTVFGGSLRKLQEALTYAGQQESDSESEPSA